MNRINIVVCLALMASTFSCRPGSDKSPPPEVQTSLAEREFYELNIRDNLDQSGEFLLSSVADEIRYIPLETTPACLLSRILRVDIFHNNIYVLDTKALYKFDMDGRFVQQIGKIGNGPGEYGSVLWFNFIDTTNEIVLYSYPTGRINVYDAESGEFKRSFRHDFQPNGVVEFPPGKLAFLTWNTKQPEDPTGGSEIYVCNLEGDVVDSIPDQRIPFTSNIAAPNHYYVYNNSLHYMGYFGDTLYSISADAAKESCAGFGLKNKLDVHQMELKMQPGETQYPDFLHIDKVIENNESIFVTVEKGFALYAPGEYVKFIFDKSSGRTISCTSLLNDLDHGIPFWPKNEYKDSGLLDFYPAIEFLEYFQTNPNDREWSDEVNTLINSIDENDNPVVILAG